MKIKATDYGVAFSDGMSTWDSRYKYIKSGTGSMIGALRIQMFLAAQINYLIKASVGKSEIMQELL